MERLENLLAELLPGTSDPRIVVKPDTQGFDLEVIRGLGSRTDHVEAIEGELTTRTPYEDVTNRLVAALVELQGPGFDRSGIFPVVIGTNGVPAIECDCLMCRGTHGV